MEGGFHYAFSRTGKASSNYSPLVCVCAAVVGRIGDMLVWFLGSRGLLGGVQSDCGGQRGAVDHLLRLKSFIRDAFVNNERAVSFFFGLGPGHVVRYGQWDMRDLRDVGLGRGLPVFVSFFFYLAPV